MNSTMTMLCTAHGSDWPEYLPIVTFAYNSSTWESNGFTPYELVSCGKIPTLVHELDLQQTAQTLGLSDVTLGTTPTAMAFHQEARNRLHTMYISTRLCQERASAKNRLHALNKEGPGQASRPVYKVNDHVLYWEPNRHKSPHADPGRT